MANKTTKKKAARRKRTARRSAAIAQGPVTLAEARALVAAARPRRALARAVDAGPTPESVGRKRKELEEERREERAQRERDYTAMMKIMKKRGVRAPTAKAEAAGPTRRAAAAGFMPLQVFAEGDSWFDYPVPFFGGGIVPRLETRLGIPILNLAEAGDEVRYMLGVKQRLRLIGCLTQGCPAGGPWDALLFSGGGNDIVDNPMALWVRGWQAGKTPSQLIDQPRFAAALALVQAGYEDLITLRDQLSPGTHLVFHGYDYALPDGRGICFLGPWLKPAFDLRGFPGLQERWGVVKEMLQQFAAMLTALTARPKVTFINRQGMLAPKKGSWHNELHPSSNGFDRFAGVFSAELKQLFPGRVA